MTAETLTAEAMVDEAMTAKRGRQPQRRGRQRRRPHAVRIIMLAMLVPLMGGPAYILLVNAFKTQQDIQTQPFGIPFDRLTLQPLIAAITSPEYNVVAAYGFTASIVIVVDIICIALAGPAAYVIARSANRKTRLLLLYFLAGTFIPGAALVIPAIYVLRTLGLVNSFAGLVLYDSATTLPVSIFLMVGYISTVPKDIDQAASIDGAGRLRTFWTIIFPLLRPAVVTILILNSIGLWNDFVSPQILLGPSSNQYTVTTAIYTGISQYTTDLTKVFPNLLLAVAPVIVFFIYMQRHIIGGLTVGATKG
ncbi:carbohydrate ABC transporter permease [Humibacter antri]